MTQSSLLFVFSALPLVASVVETCRGNAQAPSAATSAGDAAILPAPITVRERREPTFPQSAAEAAAENRRGVAAGLDVAIFGGGCFWGVEELFRNVVGVVATDVGYAGGAPEDARYDRVHRGDTGHAESVRVIFDPHRTSYEALVAWFFKIHDPTTENRQGNDVGTQYRSVIFAQSEEQRAIAQAVKTRLDGSGKLRRPVVTQVVATTRYTLAEGYHQGYLQRYPDGYTCHFVRPYEP